MAEETKEAPKKKKLVKGRHASAIKRHRQSSKKQAQNKSEISAMRTAVKRVRQAVAAKDSGKAKEALKNASSLLDRVGKKGILHRNTTSRHVSRLSKLVAKIAA
ncbi:MAG: 30S ribosomal protein S20 [Deltaproteobacteria bacterium]|nr:MAG: 30S ribosomal protein S20 [Deltaproteobacteria bacterium]